MPVGLASDRGTHEGFEDEIDSSTPGRRDKAFSRTEAGGALPNPKPDYRGLSTTAALPGR
jgi:hypothetical protein